ncbi:MAG TPA: alanyl-tRNA editing protein [Terriglobales bacterium]|nr:alanyl-tRNA editing protein [Terriglobales bacterium]
MTKRLYYDSAEMHEFDSVVEEVAPPSSEQSRPAVVLRETAFYPTSGGQVHDTGWLTVNGGDCGAERLRVTEVADAEDGRIVHYLEAPARLPVAGAAVHGSIDPERRRDHMQQHSGQHVLSAAFIELYQMLTVSFHMGEDYCSIDLATPSVSSGQIAGADKRANQIVFENRAVRIRYVSRAEAEKLGLRKLPPAEHDDLRLVEIADFDLSACGGTHVSASGQIGSILLRKTEKVRQGTRVEFVCGDRAVRMARRDYSALSEAAALFSTQLWDVPDQIRKNVEESKLLRKQKDDALDQLAELMALAALHDQPETNGRKIIVRAFSDRDIGFAKLFAQKVTRVATPAIALVASTVDPLGLVFAQTPAQASGGAAGSAADMGALLKQVLSSVGGRGGGSRDFAQGGVPAGCNVKVEQLLREAAVTIGA